MPEVSWTPEERKRFWRSCRAALWTLLVVLAIMFLFRLADPATFFIPQPLVFIVYFAALWVVVFKIVRLRTGG